jgi:O-antigen/teichoic acid export membrane protein
MKAIETFRRLSQRPEARHIGILTAGSTLAQFFLLGTAPLLARLYAPHDFGLFAMLLTVSTIGGSIGGLCYEIAIILPRSRRTAQALFALSLRLSFVMAIATAGTFALLAVVFPTLIGSHFGWPFYLACAATTALTTQFNALGYAHSRAGQYGAVSVSKLTQSVFPTLAQIAMAFTGLQALGLIVGRAIGLLGSDILLLRKLPKGFSLRDALYAKLAPQLAAARTYRDFLLQVPRQLLVRGSSMLPPALILASYGPAAAGLYFFAARLVERPGMLLGDALSRVPMKQFADRRKKQQKLTRATLLYTVTLGIPVVAAVALLAAIAAPLFRIAFGPQWTPAANYAVILAAWAAIRMASLPMATLTTVLRVQRRSFYADALFAPRVFVIPLFASYGFNALEAITAFCALSILYHLVIFVIGLHAAIQYDRTIESPEPASDLLLSSARLQP